MMKTNPTQPSTILWADDDADDRQVICEIVSAYSDKYRVLEVEDGSEVLSYLHAITDKKKLPCLVVLDINMPKLNGTETLACIKRDDRYKNLTVAVFTTSDSAFDRKICERYGAPMLTKPSSYEDFREAVTKLLQMCHIDGLLPPEAN